MMSPAERRPDMEVLPADQKSESASVTLADLATNDQGPSLIRSALAFAAIHHSGRKRDSNGAAFIEHPVEVAQLLHEAGCSDVVVAAGLLHDTVDGVARLRARFGPDVANLVEAVSEDASIPTYRKRKHVLREHVRNAGRDAALLFAADEISNVRELPDRIKRAQVRLAETTPGHPARHRLERSHQLRLEHYHESLRMLQDAASPHPLVTRLADELANHPQVHHDGVTADAR